MFVTTHKVAVKNRSHLATTFMSIKIVYIEYNDNTSFSFYHQMYTVTLVVLQPFLMTKNS